jgi:hypothetical protein
MLEADVASQAGAVDEHLATEVAFLRYIVVFSLLAIQK